MASSTPWGPEDLGSTQIIFLRKEPEVRVEGKTGTTWCRGRQMLSVSEQGTFTVGFKQLPAWGSREGTSNVHGPLKEQ